MLLRYPLRQPPFFFAFCIYIPLCFYFIFAELFDIKVGFQSTFHYASTLSETERRDGAVPPASTFHYASTLSNCHIQVAR